MTPAQLKLIRIAASRCGYNEPQYRTILRNIAGVVSTKELSNRQFEQIMAFFEDAGFRMFGKPETYFRDKAGRGASQISQQQIRMIEAMSAEVPAYRLEGLCMRFSDSRTDRLDKLTSREGYQLTEMLKAVIARQENQPETQSVTMRNTKTGSTSRSTPIATACLFDTSPYETHSASSALQPAGNVAVLDEGHGDLPEPPDDDVPF